jgi:hypothetical protein
VVESEDSNAAVIDFIGDKTLLTMLTYKRGFSKGLFQPSYTKKRHPEFHIPILADSHRLKKRRIPNDTGLKQQALYLSCLKYKKSICLQEGTFLLK